MKLSLSNSCITLSIAEHSLHFQEITTALLKFSKSFWINNTIINLATKQELWERKKLLLHLYKLSLSYHREGGTFLKTLLDAYEKPLKLVIKDTTAPIKVTSVWFKVIDKSLHVRFDKDEKFMFWYFVNLFKKYSLKYDFHKKEFTIQSPTNELKVELLKVISQKNILGNQMQYLYSKMEISSLFRPTHQCANNPKISPLKHYYLILNVTENDSLEIIRKQYIRLAKRFHPDHQGHLGEYEAKINTERFYKIQEAYEILKNSKNQKVAA